MDTSITCNSLNNSDFADYFASLMPLHIGERIKFIYEKRGMKTGVLADKIGVGRDNVYKIFQRETIDTGLLFRISEALQYNFFADLSKQPMLIDNFEQKDTEPMNDQTQTITVNQLKSKYYELLERYTTCLEENKKLNGKSN